MKDVEQMTDGERVQWVLTTPLSQRPVVGPLGAPAVKEMAKTAATLGLPGDLKNEVIRGFLTRGEALEIQAGRDAAASEADTSGVRREAELEKRGRPTDARPGEALLVARDGIGGYLAVYPSHIEWRDPARFRKRFKTLPLRSIRQVEVRGGSALLRALSDPGDAGTGLVITDTGGAEQRILQANRKKGKIVVDTIYRAMNGECPYIGEVNVGY